MNIQNLISSISSNSSAQNTSDHQSNTRSQNLDSANNLSSFIPQGLAGGAAAGGVMALLLGSKSTRKMAKKVIKYGGTAIVGGLAYKAYDNWQDNKALGQIKSIDDRDIEQAEQLSSHNHPPHLGLENRAPSLELTLITTMIAASKADGHLDAQEQQRLFDSMGKLNLDAADKSAVFDAMTRDISIAEIAESFGHDDHKAEIYLSAYLAIEVDDQRERAFLNNLAIALNLPKGFPAYLEQQADQGVEI